MARVGLVAAVAALACGAGDAQQVGTETLPATVSADQSGPQVEASQLAERGRKPRADLNDLTRMFLEGYSSTPLRNNPVAGDVTLTLCVSEKGRLRNVQVMKSSGIEAIDQASLKGILRVKFLAGRDSAGQLIDWCDPPYVLTLSWRPPPR